MSTRATGKAFELRIAKYLESIGFKTDRARPAMKWTPAGMRSGPNDFLGCADILAVHPLKQYTLLIQAHHGTSAKPRKQKLEAVPWNLSAQRVQLWMPVKGMSQGIRALNLTDAKPSVSDDAPPVWTDIKTGAVWNEFIFRMKPGIPVVGGLL